MFRLLNWTRNFQREDYTFRVLKSNKNEKVDFEEERHFCVYLLLHLQHISQYLKCNWSDEWDIDEPPIVFDDKKEIYV